MQFSENENLIPSDTISNDSSDQACSATRRSNATSERAFSEMRRIKTHLRNNMNQNSLNHTMCINVHSEKLDSIDLKVLLNEFIHSNDRRKHVFGQI